MNVFVGCSSREGRNNEYYNKIAEDLANFIVEGKHNYVFGGCKTGLMGKIYSIVSQSPSSKIIIAITELYKSNLDDLSYSKVYTLNTVNERKNCLISLADIMFFLPGGIGTIDEILAAIEAKRSHEHNAPIIILNVNNYFKHLICMLNQIYDEGLADPENKKLYFVANSLNEAKTYLSKVF